jgi:hypothetical protein
MQKLDKFSIVAKAIRLEVENNKTYIVFEIIDSDFKKQILDSWGSDIPVRMIGKNLVK